MEQLNFKLETFEGPLDLLLFLISKHKLDIYDIAISELVTQYMRSIEEMQAADMELSSEFLEMAARLVYMKSVALLPKHEEAEELKRELTGQLLEYQACREAAGKLGELYIGHQLFVRQPIELPVDKTYAREHETGEIMDAYLSVIGKAKRKLPPPASAFSGIVSKRVVSVSSRIFYVLKRLYRKSKARFGSFFETSDRSELVATFLAMLELVKAKRITVSDDNDYVYFNKDTAKKQTHGKA